jgi:hypothetical protein
MLVDGRGEQILLDLEQRVHTDPRVLELHAVAPVQADRGGRLVARVVVLGQCRVALQLVGDAGGGAAVGEDLELVRHLVERRQDELSERGQAARLGLMGMYACGGRQHGIRKERGGPRTGRRAAGAGGKGVGRGVSGCATPATLSSRGRPCGDASSG